MKRIDVKPQAKKIVIIGGVAGGMSAAARARRLSEDSEIIVLEKSGHVSYANCGLPYYLGGEIKSKDKLLVATPDGLKDKMDLDIRVRHEVVEIRPRTREILVKEIATERTYVETYDDLIVSTGAAPIRPKLPGIDLPGLFTVRSIEDVESIQDWIENQDPGNAVVAGGGFIGLEMAEQLTLRGLDVTLIDSKEQVLTPIDPEMATYVHNELRKHGVKVFLGSSVAEFRLPDAFGTTGDAVPKSGWVLAGGLPPLPADMVILGLGVRPESSLARAAGLLVGERGGIRVNEYLQTSDAHIWAVGDAIEVLHPISNKHTLISLGGPANRQGRIAADNIFGAGEVYDGTLGTAILRVFGLTVASVGLNEAQIQESEIPYEAIYTHPSHHAGYYPGAEQLHMKILFDKNDGSLLGAQVVGKQGADKRIDIIATAIKAGMTIRDLSELELAYAPPFGSAKDPINLAGMVGSNVLDGLTEQIHSRQLASRKEVEICVLDVRTPAERERGSIEGSVHIPLSELRNRFAELPRAKDIVVYCQSGQRSYIASRMLKQKGFRVLNLSGGYLTWSSMNTVEPNAKVESLAPKLVAH